MSNGGTPPSPSSPPHESTSILPALPPSHSPLLKRQPSAIWPPPHSPLFTSQPIVQGEVVPSGGVELGDAAPSQSPLLAPQPIAVFPPPHSPLFITQPMVESEAVWSGGVELDDAAPSRSPLLTPQPMAVFPPPHSPFFTSQPMVESDAVWSGGVELGDAGPSRSPLLAPQPIVVSEGVPFCVVELGDAGPSHSPLLAPQPIAVLPPLHSPLFTSQPMVESDAVWHGGLELGDAAPSHSPLLTPQAIVESESEVVPLGGVELGDALPPATSMTTPPLDDGGRDNYTNMVFKFDCFPPGYRFNPFDEELIDHYLEKKILNQPLPPNKMFEVNIYNYNPEDLAAKYPQWGDKKWFFFTSRDRKYPNGSRPNRAAGDGYWKATGSDKIVYSRGTNRGVKKGLVFYKGRPPTGDKTNWVMHEFRIDNLNHRPHKGTMKLDDCVLCRIHERTQDEKPSKKSDLKAKPRRKSSSNPKVRKSQYDGALMDSHPKEQLECIKLTTPVDHGGSSNINLDEVNKNVNPLDHASFSHATTSYTSFDSNDFIGINEEDISTHTSDKYQLTVVENTWAYNYMMGVPKLDSTIALPDPLDPNTLSYGGIPSTNALDIFTHPEMGAMDDITDLIHNTVGATSNANCTIPTTSIVSTPNTLASGLENKSEVFEPNSVLLNAGANVCEVHGVDGLGWNTSSIGDKGFHPMMCTCARCFNKF